MSLSANKMILWTVLAMNAVAESFFQLLKRECVKKRVYATREQARNDIFDYIEMFYNPIRKHTSNGLLSPINFEDKFKQQSVY